MSPIPLQIIWSDGHIAIQPTYPQSLLKALSYWRRISHVENYKRVMTNQKEELFVASTYEDAGEPGLIKQRLVTMDGFMSKVKKLLTEANYPFTVIDNRTPRPTPDIAKALEGLWEAQKPIVYTALMSGGGTISAATGYGKTRLTAAIINAYTKEQFQLRGTPLTVFAAPERDINRKNWEELRRWLPDRDVGIMMSGHKQIITDDVMCVTLDSLSNLDPSQIGLFICDEVHTGVSDSRSAVIQDMRKAIKFGVSATPSGRYDGKDPVIEALFGPVIFRKTYQEAVADGILVPITVIWMDAPEPDLGMTHYEGLKTRDGKYKRATVTNTGRNKLIGGALAAIPDTMQTVVIMPTIEHMSNILKHCPVGTGVVHAETNAVSLSKRGLGNIPAISVRDRKTIYTDMVDGKIKKILATHVYKQGVNFPGLEIMINAGGGGGEIAAKQIPGRVSRTAAGKEAAYLIDFEHKWDMRKDHYGKDVPGPVYGDDKKRRKFYTQLGFTQVKAEGVEDLKRLLVKEVS